MASLIQGFEYDIFISYRQKDNKYDGWVTEFVANLKKELEATFKEEISVYFDENPHDGLLEIHQVDASLASKIKCLVFIPIVSQTYCDPKSFAWQQEFVAFNKFATADRFGRDIKVSKGNVLSRILPVKIHDLDSEDNELLEKELGGVLRSIEFIHKSAGVNRPLKPNDDRAENLNHTYYRDQINKVANGVKEIISALRKGTVETPSDRSGAVQKDVPQEVNTFWDQMKKRNVIKVATAYAIAAWVMLQIADIVLPLFMAPAWALRMLFIILATGLPVIIVFSWMFEMTPQGLRRSEAILRDAYFSQKTGKKINRMIIIGLIAIIGLLIYDRFGTSKINLGPGIRSIAVLPFVNMSKDKDQEFFSAGITDEILDALTHIEGLKVASRTSSSRFSGKNDLKEVGKKLDVNTVLEGGVQTDGNQIRITVQLINVEDDYHIWSKKFTEKYEKPGDIFAIEDKIANAVAERFSLTFAGNESKAVRKPPTESREAHELYLKGRFFWNQRLPAALKKGIEFFEKAIDIDPLYASAYSGIADCYTASGWASFIAPSDAFPKARAAATKALELDSTLAEPHASLGYYNLYYERDWVTAEKEFQKAISLNPRYEITYDWYGTYLTAMSRFEEARATMKKALDLDPLSPVFGSDMGFTLFYGGNYDQAIKQLQATLEISPKFPIAHLWLSRAYQQKKMYKESIAEYRKTMLVIPEYPVCLGGIGNIYGEMGEMANAQKMLDTLKALSAKKYVTPYCIALVYAGMGDNDKAFQWLDKSYEGRSNYLVWLKVDPRWAGLRNDKRFDDLVRRVGLPE